MKTAHLFILATAVFLYVILTIYFFQTSINTKAKYTQPPFKVLVLISQPRSGSTYLSKIISKSMQSIYFYEPLYRLDQLLNMDANFFAPPSKQNKYNQEASKYLQSIFKCTFQEREDWSRIYRSRFRDQSNLQGNECSHNEKQQKINARRSKENKGYIIDRCMPYFDPYQLERDCQRYNLMVKLLEHRLPYKDVLNTASYIDSKTSHKVIYLVRDPRASFWSMLRLGWVAPAMNDLYKTYIDLRCKEMYKTITSLQNQNNKNFVLIRYEDIMTKPDIALQDVLTFLEKETSKKISKILNANDCYVPRFNSRFYNATNTGANQIKRMLLEDDNQYDDTAEKRQDTEENSEDMDKYEESSNENQKNKHREKESNNLDSNFQKLKEKHRKNFECFTINKWRYEVNTKFVKIVEDRCSNVMNLLAYKLLNGDVHLLQTTEHSLVNEYYIRKTEQ